MNTAIAEVSTANHPVVSRDRWVAERKTLLAREKELTRLRDQIARERRALPWVRIEKDYVFDTPEGRRTLADLFEGRRQLLVQHFMFGPGWEQGCPSCSFMADHTDGMNVHLAHRDVTLLAVSRAPLAEIERFRQRMGWQFKWVSSYGSDFNHDFGVSFTPEERGQGRGLLQLRHAALPGEEAPGISVFYKDDAGDVFHTYSTYGRGVEVMMGAYNLLDLTPKGRDEDDLTHTMEWVRHHDRYEPAPRREGGAGGWFVLPRAAPEGRAAGAREHIMASFWPWLAVAGVGALHGLNPATGWMFAAAWGVRSRDRAQALRALMPIAVGHATSVALVAAAVALGPVDGSRCAASPGGRAARRRRDASPVGPHSQAGAGAGRTCRAGALVLRDVHRARRRIDAGAGADPAVHGRRAGPGDHLHRAR